MTYVAAMALALGLTACGGQKKQSAEPAEEVPATPAYTVVDKPQVDLSKFKVDKDGYIVLFDGTSLEGCPSPSPVPQNFKQPSSNTQRPGT